MVNMLDNFKKLSRAKAQNYRKKMSASYDFISWDWYDLVSVPNRLLRLLNQQNVLGCLFQP